nr:nucleotide sugar dehydrogenase [Alteribacillus sp. YIM 98480]
MEQVENNTLKVGVIGLGFVGLPLSLLFHQKGFNVTGIDIDENKIQTLNQGKSCISEIEDEHVKNAMTSGRFMATSDFDTIKKQNILIVCVSTPLNKHDEPDLSYLKKAGESITSRLREGQLVVLESSTYPGTTKDFFKPILEQNGLLVGKDFYLAYSPERIDPGNKKIQFNEIPKLVSGVTTRCLQEIYNVYSEIYDTVVKVSSTEAAEITKLLENSYRFINISFINEFAILCDKLNINVWEVIEAASTKPYGFQPFYPGPGIGGHCIPIDPLYLMFKAKQIGATQEFIELSKKINQSFPTYITDQVTNILSNSKTIKNQNILIYGVTYKPDIEDARETPAIKIIQKLKDKGANVYYHDPYVEKLTVNDNDILTSVPLTKEMLKDVDCVIILTDHRLIPIEQILNDAKIVYDTRNVTRGHSGKAKVYHLGTGVS